MAGDDEEFTRLFQSFYPVLCRFLECLLSGRSSLAQDLAQESFVRLHTNEWGSLSSEQARFWLYRVARNLAIRGGGSLRLIKTKLQSAGISARATRMASWNADCAETS